MFVNPDKKMRCEYCDESYSVTRLKKLAENGKYICPQCLIKKNRKGEDNMSINSILALMLHCEDQELVRMAEKELKALESRVDETESILQWIKETYDTNFTEEELKEMSPTDKAIYKAVSEALK